ncbi:hypothetical protein PR048_027008 [Dryococelus australis]|uniref:Uncharacterized protein n=1 Tax=Dryococelus australis TaxID=614101 RepID=A0ABQ9GMV9_9NEOP|nr:hypothetical protein PR048_027008 [Dryococelus australis]
MGATVAERLVCSPSTKVIRVQSTARSPRIFAFGNRAGRSRWSAAFLGDLPFPLPFLSGAAPYSPQSPSAALKTSTLKAPLRVQPLLFLHFPALGKPATHKAEKNCTNRRKPRFFRFPGHFIPTYSVFTSITPNGSRDLAVKSHPDLFTHGPIPAFATSDFGKLQRAEIRMSGPGIEPGSLPVCELPLRHLARVSTRTSAKKYHETGK